MKQFKFVKKKNSLILSSKYAIFHPEKDVECYLWIVLIWQHCNFMICKLIYLQLT